MTRPALTTLRSYELVVIGNYQKYRGGQTSQLRHETEININWITFHPSNTHGIVELNIMIAKVSFLPLLGDTIFQINVANEIRFLSRVLYEVFSWEWDWFLYKIQSLLN